MARKPRIEFKGCLYHVMVRGNNGEFIFEKSGDKQMYLDLIRKYKERYLFKLYAYCILDNHVHMLIEQEDSPLSKIMQGIQQSFTQRYNKKYKRTGHVFQQRYRSEICDKDQYLFQLIKYIHYNPVKAGLEEGLNYNWSSHKEYIKDSKDQLIEVDYVLSLFANNKKKAVNNYKQFMNMEGEEVQDDVSNYLLEEADYKETENNAEEIIEVDKIINAICELEEVSIDEIIKRSRIQKYSDIRKAIVLLSDKYTNATTTELAKQLNISASMVSKIKSGSSKRTSYTDEIINKFESYSIIQACDRFLV